MAIFGNLKFPLIFKWIIYTDKKILASFILKKLDEFVSCKNLLNLSGVCFQN